MNNWLIISLGVLGGLIAVLMLLYLILWVLKTNYEKKQSKQGKDLESETKITPTSKKK